MSTAWEEDDTAQKSVSSLHLKITPADNQAVLSCESVNLVSLSPLSVSRKITVLCEWKKRLMCRWNPHIVDHRALAGLSAMDY